MFRATLSFVRLLGGWTREDRAAAGDLRRELAQDQYENGSWEDSAVTTAFRIIRLLELGATRRSGAANARPIGCSEPQNLWASPARTGTRSYRWQ